MGRSIVGRERLLGLEHAINNVDESVVSDNVLLDDASSEGDTGQTLGSLSRGAEEERSLLGPDVDLDEGA